MKRDLEYADDEPNPKRQATALADPSKLYLKALVPSNAAGSLLGKGGQLLRDFETQNNIKLKMSQNGQFFPGTSERPILMIASDPQTIFKTVEYVCEKVKESITNSQAEDQRRAREFKVILPDAVAGTIIGKGGSKIKGLHDTTGARLQISDKAPERTLTISGEVSQIINVVETLLNDFQVNVNTSLSYPTVDPAHSYGYAAPDPYYAPYSAGGFMPPQAHQVPYQRGSAHASHAAPAYAPASNAPSVELAIPDHLVGAVIGRGGKVLAEIQAQTGCRIQLSQKGEFYPGTNNRKIIFTGSPQAARQAQILVQQRMASAVDFQSKNASAAPAAY
eukprot:TRINITY_DN2817_c0_g1::TRINITY_DN2817_c0_g1_i3::g.5701::m.5701 TRINITY_DN2817_c0_g1::TRINITY_DN2817_c0_g1_i3::g.5701  ORF type:complete len:344 (+),score=91.04,sp/Q9LZ82/BTR1_ARATH/27.73/3e-40,sp/Q9LZ82/BTR1_ARATH/31.18/6e-09,sp/Q9LZ82/BTR1_ARATH/20.56/1e-06,KH_1/PF00013.24/0.00029,KH_1/PF00013.24/4.3e-11,KH_1/PF00013.24/4.1e-13,KH_3/PF13014.1/0.27,KH_3/PF13014.1/2e-08,KH_3/PF13014.1/2.1e-12,KH_2/PF07650.12/2e+02,KH_2/PF07650.12/0.005,KH_2/PF07650.12/0.15,KH_4/PF13083.1/1.6e+02,KH_4/PF13083.1/0.9